MKKYKQEELEQDQIDKSKFLQTIPEAGAETAR